MMRSLVHWLNSLLVPSGHDGSSDQYVKDSKVLHWRIVSCQSGSCPPPLLIQPLLPPRLILWPDVPLHRQVLLSTFCS